METNMTDTPIFDMSASETSPASGDSRTARLNDLTPTGGATFAHEEQRNIDREMGKLLNGPSRNQYQQLAGWEDFYYRGWVLDATPARVKAADPEIAAAINAVLQRKHAVGLAQRESEVDYLSDLPRPPGIGLDEFVACDGGWRITRHDRRTSGEAS